MAGDTSASDAASAAEATRGRGNALYKAGDLIEAEVAYMEAARLAPQDPRPFSNVSAVKFEMGNYIGSSIFGEKALKLLQDRPDPALEQRVRLRLARSYLHVRKFTQAQDAICGVTASEDTRQLEHAVRVMAASNTAYPDEKALWRTIIKNLSRFRPALQDELEYYNVGHDGANTQFDTQLTGLKQNNFSFLFAGIGDARHLFATLAYISLTASSKTSLLSKKFHFTLLDIKPTVFARDLLIFRLLSDAAREPHKKSAETLVTLSYLYAAQIMPAWAYLRFQAAIKDLVNELQEHNSDVMERFYVDIESRVQICHHLNNWRRKPQGWYSTEMFLAVTQEQTLSSQMNAINSFGPPPQDPSMPSGCQPGSPDVRGFEDIGVMLPHVHLLEKYETELLKLFTTYGKHHTTTHKKKLTQYLIDHWMPNMTLIDFDYEEKRQGKEPPSLDFTPHTIVCDLFAHIPRELAGEGVQGVLPHLEAFFGFVKNLFGRIQRQVTFEIVVDNMVNYFECAEYGLLQSRKRLGSLNPSEFPVRYDRIHMSNIPDYVGGPLTTFMHGLPILRNDKTSNMSSNVLRNPRHWVTHQRFLAEYLLLVDRQQITNTFSASLNEISAQIEKRLDGVVVGGCGAIMTQLMSWTRLSTRPLKWSSLMPRRDLEHWLHAHYLKVCLPYQRTGNYEDKVMAPLNLTVIIRLVIHLFKVGYPAHWLCGILTHFCTDTLTTTARAPRSMVTDPNAAGAVHSFRAMSIRPFVIEFRMLLSIWRRLLPFGFTCSEEIEEKLPAQDRIRHFKLRFKVDVGFYKNPPTELSTSSSVLVLWNHTMNGDVPRGMPMRLVLLDDESMKGSSFLKSRLRQAGSTQPESDCLMHVISTFSWSRGDSIASFWFPSGVMEEILSGSDEWDAYIWSTETWESVLGPVSVNGEIIIDEKVWALMI